MWDFGYQTVSWAVTGMSMGNSVWDFDQNTFRNRTSFVIADWMPISTDWDLNFRSLWYVHLFKDPKFRATVAACWAKLFTPRILTRNGFYRFRVDPFGQAEHVDRQYEKQILALKILFTTLIYLIYFPIVIGIG